MKGKTSHENEVKKIIEPMVQFLPHVLDVLGVFKKRSGVQDGNTPFIFQLCDEFPQQSNG